MAEFTRVPNGQANGNVSSIAYRVYCNKCKKLQFIHKLTASDTSKTAKITKKGDYPSAHRQNVNVLLSNITFFMIFAVLDVSLAVNLCINCSFLHLYLQFYYILELLQQNCLFGLPSRNIRPNRVVDYPSAFYCTLNTQRQMQQYYCERF